ASGIGPLGTRKTGNLLPELPFRATAGFAMDCPPASPARRGPRICGPGRSGASQGGGPTMNHRGTAACVAALFLVTSAARAQQTHRNGFETRTPVWVTQNADAKFRELVHDTTDATAHTGQLCEHIQIQAEQGTFVHYAYPV